MKLEKEELIFLIRKMHLKYERQMRKTAAKYNLSLAEALTLLFFVENPDQSNAKDVVNAKGFSKAYVSKAITSLTTKKMISITSDNKDRRCQHVALNEKSKPIVAELKRVDDHKRAVLEKNISKEDIEIFFKVLNQMTKNIITEEGKNND